MAAGKKLTGVGGTSEGDVEKVGVTGKEGRERDSEMERRRNGEKEKWKDGET